MKFKNIALLIFAFILSGCDDDHNITIVKEQQDNFFKGKTFGDVLSSWRLCESKKWESLGVDVVKFICVNKDIEKYKEKIKIDLDAGFKAKEHREPSAEELDKMEKILSLTKVQEVFYFKIKDNKALPYKSGMEYFWKDGSNGYDDIYSITMFSNVIANVDDFYDMQFSNYQSEQYLLLRYNYIVNLFGKIKK